MFLPEEPDFRYSEKVFFNEYSLRVVVTDFVTSANDKLFFRLVETYFFNESLIPAIGEGFSF